MSIVNTGVYWFDVAYTIYSNDYVLKSDFYNCLQNEIDRLQVNKLDNDRFNQFCYWWLSSIGYLTSSNNILVTLVE
jgi:hypothetical protein